MQYKLRFRSPYPNLGVISEMDVNPEVTQLRWSTSLGYGFDTLSVNFATASAGSYYYLPRAMDENALMDVRLRAGGRTLFEGRVMARDLVGGDVVGFTALGYGKTGIDDLYYLSGDTTTVTSGAVLLDAINFCTQNLIVVGSQTDIVDSAIAHTKAEFNGQMLSEIIKQLSTEGNAENFPMDWTVYEDRKAKFQPRVPPAAPQYRIPLDNTVERQEAFDKLRSHVTVTYTPSGGSETTVTGVTADFGTRYGFLRSINLKGGQLTAIGANQMEETYRVYNSVPIVATTITRGLDRGMERPGQQPQPGYLVRAGEWVQVADQTPQVVITTDYDGIKDEAKITLGNQPRGWTETINNILRMTSAFVNGQNYVSGGKLPAGTT